MMKRFLVAVLIGSIPFVVSPALGFAEDPAQLAEPVAPDAEVPAVENEEVTEFSYGTVKSVSDGQLTVTEYDYDNDKDIEVAYSVPADATLEGVGQLTEIVAGDAVDIDYVVKDGQRVVSMVSVDKGIDEEVDTEALPTEADDTSAQPQ